ncbi:hypothetical protein [Methylobacter psychrophilus]|uniref:hypothetical protein n=1 Tax=Methylobacter psychrophilus TaxID=96941 RepID=UPI0021D4C7F6|nr:hypothetical protein [Methylobacter psychrophilus]
MSNNIILFPVTDHKPVYSPAMQKAFHAVDNLIDDEREAMIDWLFLIGYGEKSPTDKT